MTDYLSLAKGMKGVNIKNVAMKDGHIGYNVPGIGFVPQDHMTSEYALAKGILERQVSCLPSDVENLGKAVKGLETLNNAELTAEMKDIQKMIDGLL